MALDGRAGGKAKTGWFGRPAPDMGAAPLATSSGASGQQSRSADLALVRDFDALYERYYQTLFNVVLHWIGDYHEAEDLTIETFASAYKARDQFRGDAQVYTWLFRIAHNHFKNRLKQRSRQREVEGPSLDAGAFGADEDEGGIAASRDVADWSYSPARLLEQKELRAMIEKAVDNLPSDYKVVLVLRDQQDLSYNEIADVTGLTLEAVKTRLNRARNMVRQRVEPYYRP
ncbi:MAG: sigma-70 family RNA polymerase sigma factor [Armatimonadota bacterium]|nr:sigma-70 family RNA polymerase sigma factor [Armatimonadota bacterium]